MLSNKQGAINYTPKTSVIGNTAYRDIQNRHYQKLETDLALKVANELQQNGIHFSGRIYDKSTTITIDSADKQEFERIVREVVNVRNRYQRKLENIDLINTNISALSEGCQIILKPLADMCYARGESFTDQLFAFLDEADDFTESQLKLYVDEYIKIYAPLKESEYLFADRTSLDRLKDQFTKDNLFDDVTYLRGYSTEQKSAIRQLLETDLPRDIYNLIDYTFNPSDIQKLGEIWQEKLTNAPERIYQHISDVKGYDMSAFRNYIRLGTYLPETAELDRVKYITDYYSTWENEDGNIIYRVPIETNVGILNRLAENGIIKEGQQNAQLILESDGRDYNVILTLDNHDVQLGNVDISDFLTDSEQRIVSGVVGEVVRLEQIKKLAHEAGMTFSNRYSEGIDNEDKRQAEFAVVDINEREKRVQLKEEATVFVPEKVEGLNSTIADDTEISNIDSPPVKIIQSEFIAYASNVIRDNQTVRNAHENSDEQNYKIEVSHALKNLITNLTVGATITGYSADETVAFLNRYQKDSEMQKYVLEIITENVDIELTGLEKTKVAAENAGLPFSDKFYDGSDDIDPYVYDGSMSVEDFRTVQDSVISEQKVENEKTFAEQVDETIVNENMVDKTGKKSNSNEQITFENIQTIEKTISTNEQEEKADDISLKNFHITDDNIGAGTQGQRFRANISAITLLKQIEAENRAANPDEQAVLAKYVGWGGLAEFFKESNPHYQELQELLTEDEYSFARATTLDSFYTSPIIIDSIYTVLQNTGFEGGNILEPSMGIGNFFGRMPQEMQEQSKLFGVEIDSLTGRIAKQLYPEAHIDIKGFEKTSFKNGSFDVAVGNIPFGDFSLQYDRQSLKIHDYFFMQALDKVKDGGIVAFVTSKGTLDKRDSSFRRQLAEKADLIGAVRLPNTAFKTAGTAVTADIIFLQKRQSPPEAIPDWVNIGVSTEGFPINEYFVQHPDMVLGEIVQGNKMYGRSDDIMCVPFDNSSLSDILPEAVSKIQATFNATAKSVAPIENSEVQIPDGIRNYSYFEYKNNIYTIENNEVINLKDSWNRSYSPANIERAKAYIQIRDTVRELLAVQQETTPDVEDRIKVLQAKLNVQYDSFYKKYGLMHSRFNSQLFRNDCSYPLMLSLEDKVDKDKLLKKSDIFYKRTIRVPEVVDKVDTPQEALVLSLAEKATVDLNYMSSLTDLPQNVIVSTLKGEIFPVPKLSNDDKIVYQTASEYLSGDIYTKLSAAKYAAESNSIFEDNISALEAAIPTPLTAGEIDIECGATWIPKEIYQQFMYETFKTPDEHRADRPPRFIWQQRGRKDIEIDYSPHTNKWNISNKSSDRSVITEKTFGTKAKNAYTIFECVLNLHIPNITKTVPDPADPSKDKKVMDIEATRLVKRKAEAIKKEFKDWIFSDPDRRKMLVDLYNRQFNCIRPREYDGSHLQFHGMNASIELHQHQKNAIAHAIYGGNTLFAHCVGAGKTYEMIATAMESKRLGLCSKSLFVVPNHLTEQVGADFMKLYPNANILVATKKDFTKQNRRKLLARIATGNYDAVIIGHSQLGMIPISPERQERMYKDQIEDITRGIAELKAQNGESFQVKAMERTRKSLQQKLEKLSSSQKDNTMYFEELGIDKLFVDEAHEFKNLMSITKLQNVSGISGRTSQRATELFMKCRYLDEKTGGKGVVFATGTPVSNSITELHTMMRYLQYDFLSQHSMQNFDNWVSVFGKQKTDYELAPTGDKFKARTRIASYANMPELMTMFKQCADVRTSDSLNLPVPDCDLHIVNADPTPLQQAMVQELSVRADDVQNGIVEPHEDNMLKITGDGRKVGLDPRLVDPTLEDNPNTKLNQCVDNVFRIWQDTAADRLTQIIFCDLGVPKPNQTDDTKESEANEKLMADIDSLEESGTFCVYDDIKSKLVEMGVPKAEIAFIHDAKTETQKSELFEKVRSGEIRVLLGSTAKMGTGTNVQDRLIALHDLDVPWRPSDLEQRRGRMIRQGNINEKVHLYRYVTKGTFDAYSYQLLETKQRFISQVITSKTPARTCSDVDQEALTYSEIKALCTGDERIKEKLTLDNRVKELQLFQKEYRDTHFELEDKVAAYPEKRELMCGRIEKLEHDFDKCKAIPFDEEGKPVFSMKIKDTEYTDRKEAAEALKTALDVVYTNRDKTFHIGEIYGFQIYAAYDQNNECIRGIIKGELEYSAGLSTMPAVNVNKLEKMTIGIEKHLDEARKKLGQSDIDIESAKEILAQPFEYAQELAEKTERLADLTDELNAEATKRLQNTEKQPRTHYFGKDMILSSQKSEALSQSQERQKEHSDNKSKEVTI